MTAKERHRMGVFSTQPAECAMRASSTPCGGRLQADHVIEVNWLKTLHDRRRLRDGIGLAPDFDEVVADSRNGLILCERHHSLKTSGLIVIPREVIPASVFEFNDDYDCAHLMESRACFA